MNLVYFGSGPFGLPTLDRLVAEHRVVLVVTQPDRPAGRRQRLAPTPVGRYAAERDLDSIKTPLVNEPEVLLCDEPTGNLDTDTGRRILDLLADLRARTGCALVMVTHDDRVAAMGDRTIRLVDGRVVQ